MAVSLSHPLHRVLSRICCVNGRAAGGAVRGEGRRGVEGKIRGLMTSPLLSARPHSWNTVLQSQHGLPPHRAYPTSICRRYSTSDDGVVVSDPVFPHLNVPNGRDIKELEGIVGKDHVVVVDSTNNSEYGHYLIDWMKQYTTRAKQSVVVFPGSTQEVAAILRYCSARKLGVVPQGGNTGLVGGGVAMSHEITLSLRRMNKIHDIDADGGAVVVDAGVILQQCDEECAKAGLMMPLDLGAKGSCFIGGNVATNAGGLRYLRYGSLHGNVLGVEAVTPQGGIIDCMSTLRKDNVGFDLKQLFIGSEGCLGIITKVAIKQGLQAVPLPLAVNVALLGLPNFQACLHTFRQARSQLGEILSAVEFVDAATMTTSVEQLMGGSHYPLEARHPFYMVLETHGSNTIHDMEKLQNFLGNMFETNAGYDGIIAADSKQARTLWKYREDAAVGVSRRGYVYKYDLSFPTARMYDIVEVMRKRIEIDLGWAAKQDVRVVGYGHLGDGNIHLNISTPDRGTDYLKHLTRDIEPFVFDWTIAHGGSVSAEHGLGQAKAKLLEPAKSAPVFQAMTNLKRMFDPMGILNPGKVSTNWV